MLNSTSEARRAKWRKKWNETMLQGFYFWRDLKDAIAGKKETHHKKTYDAYLRRKTGLSFTPYRQIKD
jgi:hypothetical protein